jgi:hypothetical protein
MKKMFKPLGIVALCIVAVITFFNGLVASTGCNYPTTHDNWSDKIAGDFFTISDVNQLRCGIEKLMTGPVRPLNGTASAPAFSFRDDPDTGMYRSAANTLDFSSGTVRSLALISGRIMGGNTTGSLTGSAAGDTVLTNTNAYRFLHAAGADAANYGIQSSADNDLLIRVPLQSDLIQLWGGAFKMAQWEVIGDGSGSGMRLGKASTTCVAVVNQPCLFARDNGGGKAQLCVQFPTGVPQCMATEP